jgi:hypothetical protein
MRLEITDDCCTTARKLIADGLDPGERLEFCRGDMVCLTGKASAFASRTVSETSTSGPRYVRYDPAEAKRLDDLRTRGRPPVR